MARLRSEAITQSDLVDYLDKYSDFSFELSVLKMLREHEVDCDHSGYYVDPVTGKSREFDIRAIKTVGHCRVRMAVECKNIGENFPILVSCVPRHQDESYHQVALVKDPKVSSIFASRMNVVCVKEKHTLYPMGGHVGKSTAQVGRLDKEKSITANDGELFEKWSQCLSSLHDMVQDTYWDGDEDDPLDAYMSAVFPFVVVPNGRLWVASYDLDGTRELGPIMTDRCSIFVGKEYIIGNKPIRRSFLVSHLEIVTFDGLRSFVETHCMTAECMQKVFPKEVIVDALRGM